MQPRQFLLVDQGDGWWHCASPLRCRVVDGPGPVRGPHSADTDHWLVAVEPDIEWRGDDQYVERWGPDHPLCHPIEPTQRAVVLAQTSERSISLDGDWSVPVSPVLNQADTLARALVAPGLGMKVRIMPIDGDRG